jgi:threonine 3-dehydrogenase
MSNPTALVTGASGEMGRLLVPSLVERGFDVVAIDLDAPIPDLKERCREAIRASILDYDVMRDLFGRHEPSLVFHLAAVLSSKAEMDSDLAHRVNVEATIEMYRMCREITTGGDPLRFLFPSSIAVYGLPDEATKTKQGAVRETEWNVPSAMYGCNKLYCELIGSYLSRARGGADYPPLDFRAIRFPGLISAETLPTGGTTDYAPEMIHAAAQNKPYTCFVSEDARLPFMTMPDGVEALLKLASADVSRLSTRVYNIRGFSASAGEIKKEVLEQFPRAEIGFEPVPFRQAIVDSWPADINDELARADWGFSPKHGLAEAFGGYLAPALRKRYAGSAAQ